MSLFRPLPPTRYEVDFQCPVEFTITHRFVLDPDVIELLHDLLSHTDNPDRLSAIEVHMAKLADAVAKIVKSVDDAVNRDQTVVADLNKQIADLKAQLAAGGLTPDEEDALADQLEAAQAKVDALDVTKPDTLPTDGGAGQPVPSSVAP